VELVKTAARREGTTDPGGARAVGEVPERAKTVYRMALTQVVSLNAAGRAGVRTWGGRGRVGAVAAVGAELTRSTFELLAYRDGDRLEIPPEVVKTVEVLTFPFTFHNIDKRRVLIQPRGPDPVYYGVRGLTPHHLLYAKTLLDRYLKPSGWAIFRTNQATDAHLTQGVLYPEPHPYSVYRARGLVVETWRTPARHLVGRLDTGLYFVVYRHLGKMASELERCHMCHVELVGGIKPRGGRLYLYVERGEVYGRYVRKKPPCPYCGGTLESAGREKRRCKKCGTVFHSTAYRWIYVETWRHLAPRPGEWRHLYRPPEVDIEIPTYFTPRDVEWISIGATTSLSPSDTSAR
ncbi:MAG: DUF1743 domain-containing protein, partial [Pyrobaculum sp.]